MSTKVTTMVPGNVWKVLVKEGDIVKKGEVLFIMEVMKTEVNHDTPVDGKINAVHVHNDQSDVEAGLVAVEID